MLAAFIKSHLSIGEVAIDTTTGSIFSSYVINSYNRDLKLITDGRDRRSIINAYLKHQLVFYPNLTDRLDFKMGIPTRNCDRLRR